MDKKARTIYIVAPAGYKTGGTELAHQLVKTLNNLECNAYIAYTGIVEGKNPINPEFQNYVADWIDLKKIIDNTNNIIIVPEIQVEYLKYFPKSKKVIWWMSVDNFAKYNSFSMAVKYFGFLRAIKGEILRTVYNKLPYIRKNVCMNLYQSEYARLYLNRHKLRNVIRLSDYINDIYFMDKCYSSKKNYVLYNPKKGLEFTKRIMNKYPQYNWKPIENMTNNEVRKLLSESKVYVDFGCHPGKDRFPREAAISGCCVITGKKGAANNDIDINIPSEFKFEGKNRDIDAIANQINNCLKNYEVEQSKYEGYRESIRNEKNIFNNDAKNLILHLDRIFEYYEQ